MTEFDINELRTQEAHVKMEAEEIEYLRTIIRTQELEISKLKAELKFYYEQYGETHGSKSQIGL